MVSAAGKHKNAEELGASDAEELIATVLKLARLLSKGDVAKVQKVLDAAVLNREQPSSAVPRAGTMRGRASGITGGRNGWCCRSRCVGRNSYGENLVIFQNLRNCRSTSLQGASSIANFFQW